MIISIWQYFILANYTWILMEGLYLHNLIFLALFTDTSSISLYIGLGWGKIYKDDVIKLNLNFYHKQVSQIKCCSFIIIPIPNY